MNSRVPEISGFKPLELTDQAAVSEALRLDPPMTSELTFTNLFIWRRHYHPQLAEINGCLAVVLTPEGQYPFALPPFGAGDKAAALAGTFKAMAYAGLTPLAARVDDRFVEQWLDKDLYEVSPEPDQSDYVYLTGDLISLSGRKLHQKKNHLNQFTNNNVFGLSPLDRTVLDSVLEMQESWCRMKQCALNPELLEEDLAVFEALTHYTRLGCRGLAVLIDGRVQAFAIGEPLNPETAVIHLEKANPEIRGLYAAINHFFCRETWAEFRFVNREQDLGVEGLRQAKQSYNPHHLVEKFRITAR